MKTLTRTSIIVFLTVITLSSVLVAQGFTIEKNPNVPVENDFVVGPAKIETEVNAGDTKTVSVVIDNKTGRTQTFSISFEDFVGTDNLDQTVQLLGDAHSSTTLKDYLSVEKNQFTLDQGDRAIVPVTISIPLGTPAGGRFGSVVVSAVSNVPGLTDTQRTYTGAVVIGRVAALLFVTVPGDTNPQGQLVKISTENNKKIFFSDTVALRTLFQNTGNVNLNPYGQVQIKNMFGHIIATQILDPQFVLPGSERTRDVLFQLPMPFGFYKAIADVNRGYGNVIDEQTVSFFVISPLSLLGLIVLVLVLLFIIREKMVSSRSKITHYAE